MRRFALCVTLATVMAASALSGAVPAGHRLQPVVVSGDGDRVVIGLRSSGDMIAAPGKLMAPTRIFVDLQGVRPAALSAVTPVGLGAVRQVRVALNRARPLVTRVVVDLDRDADFALERGDTQQELRLVIRSRRPDAPASASDGGAATAPYAVWFVRSVESVSALLERTMRASETKATLDTDVAEWERLLDTLQRMSPPEARRREHGLLIEAVRLGRIAAATRVDASRLVGHAQAGEAGARLLLAQARASVALAPQR